MKAILFTTLLSVLAVVAASAAPVDRKTQQQIRSEYEKITSYTKRKNVEGLLRQMTPDFLYVDEKKRVMSRQFVEMQMRQQFAATKSVDGRSTSIKKMEKVQGAVRVTTQEYLALTLVDAQGIPRKVVNRASTVDTWVKTSDGWKIKKTQVLKSELFIDGKKQ